MTKVIDLVLHIKEQPSVAQIDRYTGCGSNRGLIYVRRNGSHFAENVELTSDTCLVALVQRQLDAMVYQDGLIY